MAALETVVEWLRPLVRNKPWDYCVIWKLGDDPSRFIEWGACCCSGGNRPENIIKVKDENGAEKNLIAECKDRLVKHLVGTNACKKLAQLPSVIPLYSGIHGDVVISKQPRWTAQSNPSASDDETSGTQVLIPVACGLIELFSTNHIPQPNNYSSFEGSSTCSSLSNEHQQLQIGPDPMFGSMSPEKSSREYVDSPNSSLRLKRKKYTDVALAQGNDQTVAVKVRQKAEKGPYKSKNLMTERNRRKRIKDGMFALRALVPKISKKRTPSRYDAKPDLPKLIREKSAAGGSEKNPLEVKVEVSQLGRKDFLLKLICNQKRGGFTRLMEAVDSLGLKVLDANVTTFNGSVLNVLQVEVWEKRSFIRILDMRKFANKTEVEPNALKHSLLQLVN
ncbi:UNVERIFIED_CONTAM: Transcription factor [Sesamum angustifolium]|uniref:Transcription factor n=1 Tax=Sesamum angustifolium TaxID=2727405 RepID=A0AAW2QTD0_9LAMI